MRLVHKFLLMALLPVILGGAAIMVAGLYLHRDILERNAEELSELRLEHHVREIGDFYERHLGIMSMLVATRVMQEGSLQEILGQLKQWESRLPDVEGLYYNEADGTVHDTAGRTFSSADRFYYPAICRGETVITRQITSRGSGERIVLMLMPVFDSGSRRTGALGSTVKISRMTEKISAIRVGRTGYALLVDDEGTVVAAGGAGPGASAPAPSEDLHSLGRAIISGAPSSMILTIDGEVCRVYHRPIPPSRWSLALVHKEAEVMAPVRRYVTITAFMLAGTGLLVVIMAAVFHGLIAVPVRRLMDAQGRIAAGDLGARVSGLPSDEMGDLGESLNDMAGRLAAAKASLQESEALFRSQFDLGNIGIAIASPGDGLVRVNPFLCAMLGYEERELQMMGWEDITCPEDSAEVGERVEGLAAGRFDSYEAERRLLGRGGRIITAHAAVSCLRNDDGTLRYVIASFLDITQRKRAEEARELLTAILENTSDLVSISDPDGRLTYMNRSGRAMLGWENVADIGARRIDEGHPGWALRTMLGEGMPAAMEKGLWQGETAVLAGDGHEIPVSQVIMAHRRPDGSVRSISTIMRDISESRRIQESLRESEEKFRTIFEFAPFSIALTAMDGTCLDVNEALCQAHAADREKVIGRKMQENPDAMRPDNPDDALRLGKKLMEQGWLRNEEVELYRPSDGRKESVLVSSRIITLAGKPAVLSMTVEVTERRKMEQQLAQAQKMEAVGLLAGGVAHDFNNLLQAILGYTELAMAGLEPGDPGYASLAEVKSAGRRAAELTRQLLAFSRRQVLKLENLDLNSVIAGVMKMLRRLIGEDIELMVMPGHELPAVNATGPSWSRCS
jgi:PAS domain S-box-containing protein